MTPREQAEEGPRKGFEQVFGHVLHLIVTFRILPGETLYETTLAAELNLSRTPVQHALTRLVTEGFLERPRGTRGYRMPRLSPEDMRDVFLAREVVEGTATALAAARATKEDVRRLREINAQELALLGDGAWQAYVQANDDFHLTLVRIGGNRYLEKIFLPLYWRSQLYVHYLTDFHFLPREELLRGDRPHVSPREHAQIVDAVEARNEALARDRAVEHLRQTLAYRLSRDAERAARIFVAPQPRESTA